jgi:hypothetical protein
MTAPGVKPRKKFVVGTDDGADDSASEHGRSLPEVVGVTDITARLGEAVESHRDTKLRYVKPYPSEEVERMSLEKSRIRSKRLSKEEDSREKDVNNIGGAKSENSDTAKTSAMQTSHHAKEASQQVSSARQQEPADQSRAEERADQHRSPQSQEALQQQSRKRYQPSISNMDDKNESTTGNSARSVHRSNSLGSLHLQRYSSSTISRTQQKLELQRQHCLADDENYLTHPRNQLKLTKVMERINREHAAIRMYRDPIAESMSRAFARFAREHPEILDEDYGRGFDAQHWNDDPGRKGGVVVSPRIASTR